MLDAHVHNYSPRELNYLQALMIGPLRMTKQPQVLHVHTVPSSSRDNEESSILTPPSFLEKLFLTDSELFGMD